MTEKRRLLLNRLEIVGFILYFILLFIERLLAVIFSVNSGGEYALTSGNFFNYIAYAVTAFSLVAGTVLAVRISVKMARSVLSGNLYSFEMGSRDLVVVAVMLFGGMMHTGYTLAGVQFAAYGFLIAAMILRVVEFCLVGGDKYLSIVSVIYLTLFSMAIPVAYISSMEMPLLGIFYAAEFLAVFALVPTFGYMLYLLMKEGVTTFSPVLPAVMLLLSGGCVALKWGEEINTFVLIFVVLTALVYLSFGIASLRRTKVKKAGSLTIRLLDREEGDLIADTAAMAAEIWHEHYDPILGREQVDYMIERFQSPAAIEEQITHGYSYALALFEGQAVGFFAYYLREDALYLSKIYLLKGSRGKGYAREILSYLVQKGRAASLPAIELNVNKHNDLSIAAYEKLGFRRIRAEKNDIGEGYYMDDYVYRFDLAEGEGK